VPSAAFSLTDTDANKLAHMDMAVRLDEDYRYSMR